MKESFQRVEMDPQVWELFRRYTRELNRKLAQQGLPAVRQGQIVGAIVTRFLLAHRSEIMEAHATTQLQQALGAAARLGGSNSIVLSEAALATDLPDPGGVGENRTRRR